MSIPADFRRVLEAGDPDWREGTASGLRIVYGDHLKGRIQAYTISAYEAIVADIRATRPKSNEESQRKAAAIHFMVTQSALLEVDRDGRVVLPLRQREKIGLTEGEAQFAGKGDHFEIWSTAAYQAGPGAAMAAIAEARGEFYDPMADIYAMQG